MITSASVPALESTPPRVTQPGVGPDQSNRGALPAGTRLREFEITRLLGGGGFGMVYQAEDRTLGRQVALKEYMPGNFAVRGADLSVSARSGDEQAFELGLRSFVNEAHMLARFDHPSLVRVYQFWEERGTAYMAMPFYQGLTLRRWLKNRTAAGAAEPPDESTLRAILLPLLDALEVLHAADCFHRDIAPDNILLLAEGNRPVLLDFGSARRVIGDATQALTAFVKPGFAPIEQYSHDDEMRQGPWTDIYGLAATLYFAITGECPPSASSRLLRDRLAPVSTHLRSHYSEAFLHAIDLGLKVRPEHRLQSVRTWRSLIDSRLSLAGDDTLALAGSAEPRSARAIARDDLRGYPVSSLAAGATPGRPGTGPGLTRPPRTRPTGGPSSDLERPFTGLYSGITLPVTADREPIRTGGPTATPSTAPGAPLLRRADDERGPASIPRSDIEEFVAIEAAGPRQARSPAGRMNTDPGPASDWLEDDADLDDGDEDDGHPALEFLKRWGLALAAALTGAALALAFTVHRHSARPQEGDLSSAQARATPAAAAPALPRGTVLRTSTPVETSVASGGRSCESILRRAAAGERINAVELSYLESRCSE